MAVLSAISGVIGAVSSMAAVAQQRKAAALQQKQSELQSRRSNRQAMREAQLRRAQTIQGAVAGGVNFSSGMAGGVASLGSQFGEASGYSTQMSGLNKEISMAQQRASTMQAFGGLVGDLFQGGKGQTYGGLFSQRTSPTPINAQS